LANGGGFYHPFAYVAEAMRMGIRVLPPDVNASAFRTTGRGQELRIGLQYIKGLSRYGAERLLVARTTPYRSLADLTQRAGLTPDDLRILVKVGALDAIAGAKTQPMLLWEIDAARIRRAPRVPTLAVETGPAVPPLKPYSTERRRREQYQALGFLTDHHPMDLHADTLGRFRLCRSTLLHDHVGQRVLAAGMLTTAKPVHTVTDEPMQFATFDDGAGLIETVLFPRVYRERGHLLFDQGPFIFRGLVEEQFGVATVTITHLDRLERMVAKLRPVRADHKQAASDHNHGHSL
jgi:error-prone DNA polymerase